MYTKWLYFTCLLLKCNYLIAEDISLNNDEEQTYTCDEYVEEKFNVVLEYGYSLLVNVTDIAINGGTDCGDYLLITSGYEYEQANGIAFTNTLSTSRQFIINSDNTLFHIKLTDSEKCKIEDATICKFTYRRIGAKHTTTTEKPTTENPWPTPSVNDSIYSTVYIGGKRGEEYLNENVQFQLKTAIARMAIKYCKDNISFNQKSIGLTENITEENVQIYEIKQCIYSWPESSTCVQMQYKLPIKWTGDDRQYKLTGPELDLMWLRYAKEYLHEWDLYPYELKDIDGVLTFWYILLAFILALAMFLVLFVVLVKYKCIWASKNEDDDDDGSNIGVTPRFSGSNRSSINSYNRTSLPSMFGDYNDVEMRTSSLMFRDVDGTDNPAYEIDA